MDNEYGLIVSFPDQSETFVLGFEAGMIWQRLESGETEFEAVAHAGNSEVIYRMANAKNLDANIHESDVEGWVEVYIKPKAKLKLVKGGLSPNTQ
tara:strand:- start:269 stop:553 length:285 start_codon:yes stop_codon:yes gene_type:complete